MGLDTTHNAWHGPYSTFNEFRRELLKAYNGMDLFEFEGYESRCQKDLLKPSPKLALENIDDPGLLILMDHADCEGLITWQDCTVVAESIRKVMIKLPVYHMQKAMTFITGCLLAYSKKQDLIFQ